jgi:DNA transformation protein
MPEQNHRTAELPNLGTRAAEMLAAAGIESIQQIRDLTPVVTFLAVRQAGGQPSLNLLWAIAGGLQDRDWTELSEQEKSERRSQLEELTK